MTTRVIVTAHVRDFLRSLAPEPRRRLWRGIKNLADGKGDIKQLDGELADFWRLRVNTTRMIFYQTTGNGKRLLACLFASHRATVYAVMEQLLASGLIEELKQN
jgi:mRNA-degrading endonuclease RelE of RelBE toxin-antitoxin system